MRAWTILFGVIASLTFVVATAESATDEPAPVGDVGDAGEFADEALLDPAIEAQAVDGSSAAWDTAAEEPTSVVLSEEEIAAEMASSEPEEGIDGVVDPSDSERLLDSEPVDPDASDEAQAWADPSIENAAWEANSELMGDADALDWQVETEVGAESNPAAVAVETDSGSADSVVPGQRIVRQSAELGPEGVDTEGRRGRVHTVVTGDTLWDISDAYLGTPWVWPSVWQDNLSISNPHQINPGDRIWITSTLMMPISEEQAEEFISGDLAGEEVADDTMWADADPADIDEAAGDDLAAAEETVEGESDESDEPMDQLSLAVAEEGDEVEDSPTLHVSWLEDLSTLTNDVHKPLAAIVGSPEPRDFFGQGDPIYIGLGAGEVAVGDQLSIYRKAVPIHDTKTGRKIGYSVVTLGWCEVVQVDDESSIAKVRQSIADMSVGDRVLRRTQRELDIPLKAAPSGLHAEVVYLPLKRAEMGQMDYVYINRGEAHGLETGMELEIYNDGAVAVDEVRKLKVNLPDVITAQLVVVDVEPETAVAIVIQSTTEIEVGAVVRARSPKLAQN